jgi:DNA-binding transcriptional regulator PaaX
MRLVYEFGDFLYLDPFLPPELLPQGWLGYDAWQLFRDSYLLLMEPALAFFESCFEGPSRTAQEQREGRLRTLEQTPFKFDLMDTNDVPRVKSSSEPMSAIS